MLESGSKECLDSLGAWEGLRGATIMENLHKHNGGELLGYRHEEEEDMARTRRPFVVLFRGVEGTHNHEIDSPSFYNIDEVTEVVATCSSLVQTLSISSKDIGVIGAFRSQVLKLRLALRKCGLSGINVGSVEDFQGQETRIVVVSTVLSRRIPSLEIKGSLGLLGDHRRFNVAITRGMQLVVIVGHPNCLHTDSNWSALMKYCDRNGAYSGSPCSLLTSAQAKNRTEREVLNDTARLSLLGGGLGEGMAGGMGAYYYDNMEWRGML